MEVYQRMYGFMLLINFYQTLPLYSNLKTTGVYIYAEDIRVKSRKAVVHAESEIKNEYNRDKKVAYKVEVF